VLGSMPPLTRACFAFAALLVACSVEPVRRDPALDVPRRLEVDELPALEEGEVEALPPAIADPTPPTAEEARATRQVIPAAAEDGAYDSDEPVEALRFVYRVHLDIPGTLAPDARREASDVATPAAELFVDVSSERLRARFVGPGWPVEAGSEIRLRGDSPGAYVFDRDGGRPLLPGELAAWFEGGAPRAGPQLVVRRDPLARATTDPGPGVLLCALLAEWAGDPRDTVMRRCATGAPLTFRVGFWRGERTAEVPVEIPRRELRADHHGGVSEIARGTSRAFLEPSALARIPARAARTIEASDDGLGPPPAEGLELVNQSDTRVIVIVDGVAVGWVDGGATGRFVGLTSGFHEIAAMRGLGAVVMRPRDVLVPGRTILRAVRRPD
jgi:hypothetical protein